MVPELSRRQLLGGGVFVGLGGAAAFLPARYLPRPLAIRRTRWRPVPEVKPRPPVSDGHLGEARSALTEAVDRAAAAVDGLDGSPPREAAPPGVRPESSLSSAREYLDAAADADGWAALFDVRFGLKWAGQAVGSARVLTGEASGEFLAERARQLLGSVAESRDRVDYVVGDPSTGLARLYWVEKWLALATLNSYRDGTYYGQDQPSSEYDPYDVVQTWGGHFQARRLVADAERLRADYREELSERRPLSSHVAAAARDLEAEARSLTPDEAEFDARTDELDGLDPGAYRTLRRQLFYARQNSDVRTDDGPWAGLALYRALINAETVLVCRGATYAREHTALEPGGTVAASDLARAKREAMSLLRRRRRTARDRPVLELLLREGRRLVWAGDTDLERRGEVDHPAAEAYGKYLRAVGYLRTLPDVAARIDRPDRR